MNVKKRKLSEIPLEKCIYMSMGPHGGETVEQIVERKQDEIRSCGWSLWAFSSPIALKMHTFCEKAGNVYVVMAITGEAPFGKTIRADNYYQLDNPCKRCGIPSEMLVTYSGRKAYALVVEDYYEIDPCDNMFAKGNYVRKSYFNGVEILEKEVENSGRTNKRIAMAVKLKPPYIVAIK